MMRNERAPSGGRRRVRFGAFTLALVGRSLHRDGQRVRLPPKPFDALASLVENRYRVIDQHQVLEMQLGR